MPLNRNPQKGFTLVELMVGILLNAVLVLMIGSMLFYSYSAWGKHVAASEMQRDGTFAMQMITGKCRAVSAGRVQTATGILILPVDPLVDPTLRFYDNGNGSLMFDPDVGDAGPEVTVIDGRLVSFVATVDAKALYVLLTLTEATENTTIRSTITFRN